MSKAQDMAKWRTEGLDMALRLARRAKNEGKDPAEAIARELRFRGASGVCGRMTEAEYSHDTAKIKLFTIKTLKAVALISAWEAFGFGRKRLEKLDAQMEVYAKALVSEEIGWTDILEMLEEKMQRKVSWIEGD